MNRDEILRLRRKHIGGSLSLSYKEPLHIVRGRGAYLYDESGREYLDVVNNVCHVGHCHPRVVAAGAAQMATLNTNTRYLHPGLVRYAQRLSGTLPEHLSVCFFTCSGSEANDLALRIARTATGRSDVAIVGAAYHGNSSALIDISPYKFDGPGGSGKAAYVHQIPAPDDYRGPFKRGDADAGARYANELVSVLARARSGGREVAAFFCESVLGCAGQIVPPEGFLRSAFDHAREDGVITIADEVQVGFGRVGSHFWAFEAQGARPDIVTLGKPIGNGHPLAAVVTTRELAASFDNGMEYFNTFGGNPVSCAIGMAVLDVIEDEGLQQNARTVGALLLAGLGELGARHEIVGDVRGRGLFLGLELVRDRGTLEPAADEASELIEAMKERGVLLSTDGPLHNVIKMKPPLVFSEVDAARLLESLDDALARLR